MTPAENVEKIETMRAASGRVQASVIVSGVLAAARLLSTTIQQELDHEPYTETIMIFCVHLPRSMKLACD